MSADPVPPVTGNEREMQSGGACGLHGVYVGRRCPRCAQISEVEGTVPSAWYLDMKRERDRLVAALSAATTERDEWKNDYYRDVAAHYDAKIAAQRRAEGLAAQLREARGFIERARPLLGIALRNSLGKQADDLYVSINAALEPEQGEWAECRARSATVRATPSCTEPSSAAAGAAPNEAEQT